MHSGGVRRRPIASPCSILRSLGHPAFVFKICLDTYSDLLYREVHVREHEFLAVCKDTRSSPTGHLAGILPNRPQIASTDAVTRAALSFCARLRLLGRAARYEPPEIRISSTRAAC